MNAFRVLICALLPGLWLESAAAQPSLTTIRDTVYRADGSPFNGIATIEWKNFQSVNQTNVGTQATTVRIVAGALFVRLTPTTTSGNGSYYLVRYNSNGQFQFSEIWAVPSTTAVLRLRDVRASLLPGGVVVGGGAGGVIVGNTGGGDGFADGETPGGVINGANAYFTLTAAPSPATSLALYRNGLLQSPVTDYTLSGAIITFTNPALPQPGDLLRAYYRSGTGSGGTLTTHALLSTAHSDTAPATPARGALIVGQGTTPAWGRLTLGAANRCLTSNGTDAVWNTCLYTGFASGTIPFTGVDGSLTSNSAALAWNNTDRKMAVGNGVTTQSTLYVYDDRPTGLTSLLVRAGAGQGSTPIQTWFTGNESVAWVNADGSFNLKRIFTSSTSTRASISDLGTFVDPAGSAVGNGDVWFNRSTATWKSREAGQTHTGPQVICSANGLSTTSLATVANCTIPGGLLLAGDRVVIEAQFRRTAGAGEFSIEARLGTRILTVLNQAATDTSVGVRISVGVSASQLAWTTLAIRDASVSGGVGQAAFTAGSGGQIQFDITPAVATDQTVQLHSFTVTRYPAQINP